MFMNYNNRPVYQSIEAAKTNNKQVNTNNHQSAGSWLGTGTESM